MKKLFYFTVMLMACAIFNASGQARIPGASTTQTITQDFGLGKIIVTYSRPNVKGRKIFGGLQPYGEVWRTGANSATSITFTENVIMEGNKVPAGEYGLFTIPGADEWTIILNKTAHQWGAYTYKQEDDFLRFKVKNNKLPQLMETMTMEFNNVDQTKCELQMAWENSSFTLHISTDVDSKVMANIADVMN